MVFSISCWHGSMSESTIVSVNVMATLGTIYSAPLVGLKQRTHYIITVTAMSTFGDAAESQPIYAVLTGETTIVAFNIIHYSY